MTVLDAKRVFRTSTSHVQYCIGHSSAVLRINTCHVSDYNVLRTQRYIEHSPAVPRT